MEAMILQCKPKQVKRRIFCMTCIFPNGQVWYWNILAVSNHEAREVFLTNPEIIKLGLTNLNIIGLKEGENNYAEYTA